MGSVPLPVGTQSESAFVGPFRPIQAAFSGLPVWNFLSLSFDSEPVTNSCLYATLTSILQIKRAISSWIHKFADTAEKALSLEFTRQGLQIQEERATFVQRLLGNAGDMSDKKRPFIWESAYDEPSARQEVLFQT